MLSRIRIFGFAICHSPAIRSVVVLVLRERWNRTKYVPVASITYLLVTGRSPISREKEQRNGQTKKRNNNNNNMQLTKATAI